MHKFYLPILSSALLAISTPVYFDLQVSGFITTGMVTTDSDDLSFLGVKNDSLFDVDFMQWVFFYNNGVIRENQLPEQDKMIKFNHLVTNLVILHNVNNMTNIIRKLQRQGFDIPPELLAGLSPYRWEHINLLGLYQLITNKKAKARYMKIVQ